MSDLSYYRHPIGARVTVNNPSHSKHGQTGIVVYHGTFMGSVGVNFNHGDPAYTNGFWPDELEPAQEES